MSMVPLATVFPPIPQTVWNPGDAALTLSCGTLEDGVWRINAAGLAVHGPHITLDSGMFGVEFQLGTEPELDPALAVAQVQITADSGDTVLVDSVVLAAHAAQQFRGMYGGARLNLILGRRTEDIEFHVTSLGICPILFRGLKIVPRPGFIWFPAQLEHDPGAWRFNADRSGTCLEPTRLGGPSISLPPGEYRVGIKFAPPSGTDSGSLAEIATTSPRSEIVPTQLVTAEQVLANFGIPDSKMRFKLDQDSTEVELPIRTLVPGVTIQWVRLATADESVWQHYYNLGGLSSPLNAPTSGFEMVLSGATGARGLVRRFAGGWIVWTIAHGPCEVMGSIQRQYEAQGGWGGVLGFPVSRPIVAGGKTIQEFEGGSLSTV